MCVYVYEGGGVEEGEGNQISKWTKHFFFFMVVFKTSEMIYWAVFVYWTAYKKEKSPTLHKHIRDVLKIKAYA